MSTHFKFNETKLAGLYTIIRKPIIDERGYFSRFFCNNDFSEIGFSTKQIVQINHTKTKTKYSVRGLHFQYPPYAETKIVNCIKGKILDVAVDLRKGSETYLKWHAEMLSDRNQTGLYIPEGFAHGFQTLTNDCELIYLHTAAYEPSAEGIINVCDPLIGIDWPETIAEISDRDNKAPMLNSEFKGISLYEV